MYKCVVAKINRTIPIPGADRIHIAVVLGSQVIVSKDWLEGHVGLFFQDGTQLSDKFCHDNNLYRDSTLNIDKEAKGFFETSRRVRAQPFLKVKSEGFFCGLEAVSTFSDVPYSFKVGDSFDTFGTEEVCRKYVSPQTLRAMANNKTKQAKVDYALEFNKHTDTDQLLMNAFQIPTGALISMHHKVHGTSARYSKSLVTVDLNWFQKMVNKHIYPMFPTTKIEYLCGTRNVVITNPEKEGFHGSEGYRFEVLEMLKPHLSEGMTIYGEIAGYANGKPIMGVHSVDTLKDKKFTEAYGKTVTYTYGCKESEYRFHVYRITLNRDGIEMDFTAKQVKKWCEDRGINPPLDMVDPFIYDGNEEKLKALAIDVAEHYSGNAKPTEDPIDSSHVNEGVIVRVDDGTLVPKFYKYKTYAFRVMEGIFKEKNVDLEDAS
ncbi:MAG: hypothetical protein ACRC6R_07290 [Bacteroidales bacterium]